MANTSHPLIHIGFHKTGTTWLQKRLLVSHHGYFPLVEHPEISKMIVEPLGLTFDPQKMRDYIARSYEKLPEHHTGILSSELLCGNPLLGGREGDVFANRLQQIFPAAKILITIRSQNKILQSTYAQYVSRGGTMTAEHFFSGAPDMGYYGFDLEHFKYHRLVELYQKKFKAENVLVVPQETLKKDIHAVGKSIALFSGNGLFEGFSEQDTKSVGVSYPEHALPFLRRVNHVRASTLQPNPILNLSNREGKDTVYRTVGYVLKRPAIARVLQHHRPVSDVVKHISQGVFGASNKKLKTIARHPLDLAEYDVG